MQGAGCLDNGGGVDVGVTLDHQELVKHADGRQTTCPAARPDAIILEQPEEGGDISG